MTRIKDDLSSLSFDLIVDTTAFEVLTLKKFPIAEPSNEASLVTIFYYYFVSTFQVGSLILFPSMV